MIKSIYKFGLYISKKFSRYGLNDSIISEINKINSTDKALKILNIGAGGEIATIVNTCKGDIITIDIDEARKPDIVMDVTCLKFDDQSFDVIFMMEVLEHIKDPFIAISELHRVLKDDGELILSVPFIYGIHDHPYDFFRYTKFGLKEIFNKFSTISITERNDYLHAIIVLISRLMYSEYRRDQIIGLLGLVSILVSYPILYCISKLIKTKNITSGYFCKVVK